jgi:hypothetical protein
MRKVELWASLVGAVAVAFIIAIWVPGEPAQKVVHAIEYGGLIITFLFGFMILAGIASGSIDISRILEEKGSKGASMSRFQLLIFTFVIAISLFLIVVNTGQFPTQIPPEVLTLLGISATTYAVSKGISAGSQSNGGQNGGSDQTSGGSSAQDKSGDPTK